MKLSVPGTEMFNTHTIYTIGAELVASLYWSTLETTLHWNNVDYTPAAISSPSYALDFLYPHYGGISDVGP